VERDGVVGFKQFCTILTHISALCILYPLLETAAQISATREVNF